MPLLLIVSALGLAIYLLALNPILQTIRESKLAADGGAPHLSQFEKLYLRYVLTQQTDALYGPAAIFSDSTVFVIESGSGASQISADLQSAGLLDNTELFLNYANYYGYDRQFEAGRFLIEPGTSVADLAEQLTNAQPFEVTFRFLEGWRREEMAANFDLVDSPNLSTVSYTHLTLPTICSV